MKTKLLLLLVLALSLSMTAVAHASELPVFSEEALRTRESALEEYWNEDHTPLETPALYRILWLGYTHVTFGELDFQMTDFDREYLAAVAKNFEAVVEKYAEHNVDIEIDLFFIDAETPLMQAEGDDWLYLDQETIQGDIDEFCAEKDYNTVLTTVQTAGEENEERNIGKAGYDKHYVILGLEIAGISKACGYSTFLLGEPAPESYPLADPETPSLYATAVAVHEWMHQLEGLGPMLGIEYPNTHAYLGEKEFPGYQTYTANQNNYDFFEFYEQVLRGELPWTGENGEVKHVRMYPHMWQMLQLPLVSGVYTIQNAEGNYLSGREEEPRLFVARRECLWTITAIGGDRYVLSPVDLPEMRMDLSNAWDEEGNTVGLWYDSGYLDAQSWYLDGNENGSYTIRTPYESGRLVTVNGVGVSAFLGTAGEVLGTQEWFINRVEN